RRGSHPLTHRRRGRPGRAGGRGRGRALRRLPPAGRVHPPPSRGSSPRGTPAGGGEGHSPRPRLGRQGLHGQRHGARARPRPGPDPPLDVMTSFSFFGTPLFIIYSAVGHLGLVLATGATAALAFLLRQRAWTSSGPRQRRSARIAAALGAGAVAVTLLA